MQGQPHINVSIFLREENLDDIAVISSNNSDGSPLGIYIGDGISVFPMADWSKHSDADASLMVYDRMIEVIQQARAAALASAVKVTA